MYPLIKHLHVTFAALSLLGFSVRGYWMLRAPRLLTRRWVRVAPHVVDTLLLLSGLALVALSRLYPTQQPWLAAKLIALVAYIALGTLALKRGRTRRGRAAAFAAALATFAYIAAVALTHDPLPWR